MQILDRIQVFTLLEDIERYDNDTFMHCVRVNNLSMMVAENMHLSEQMKEDLFVASLLHDYGKIFIPKKLLFKKGRMTTDEYHVAKLHVKLGVEYLKDFSCCSAECIKGIRQHHERLDGLGYPDGICNIGILGRIIGVVDVFDALTDTRCYKGRCSREYSRKVLRSDGGIKLDEEVINCLEKILDNDYVFDDEYLHSIRERSCSTD